MSYSFTSNVWASLNSRYAFRGDTLVDDVDQHDWKQSATLGSELNFSLSSRHSLLFLFARTMLPRDAPVNSKGRSGCRLLINTFDDVW